MMLTRKGLLTTWLFAVTALSYAIPSCGDIEVGPQSRAVGAACASDGDCAQRCLIDDRHFPGGMCTQACTRNADCPGGSVCLAEEGGRCVVACAADADCATFGRGFTCNGEQQVDGGEALVCRVP
jgi:Cys-rich repeat protein